MHKSHDLTGFDPVTGDITRLYNPRKSVWSEHFAVQDNMEIIGFTPEGRTTVGVLQMNIRARKMTNHAYHGAEDFRVPFLMVRCT